MALLPRLTLATCLLHALAATAQVPGLPDVAWTAPGHVGIDALDISPDGSLLATGSSGDHTIKLRDVATGRLIRTLAAHAEGVRGVAFSPDGTLLASAGGVSIGSGDVNVKLWDVATGSVVRTFGPPDGQESWCVAFSPDGTLLAVGSGFDVLVYRVADASLVDTLTGHSWYVFAVGFSPDGTLLASASGDRTARLWRVSTGALVHELTGHSFFLSSLAFSPDGTRLATGSWDQSVRVWDVSSGAGTRTLMGNVDAVNAVAWSPDGTRVVSGATDGTLHAWDPATGVADPVVSNPSGADFTCVRYLPSGASLVAGSHDGRARRFGAASGGLEGTYGDHSAGVSAVAWSHDGRLVSGSLDRLAKVWRASDGTRLFDLVGHDDVINQVAVTPDDQVVATAAGAPPPDTRDPTVKLWSMADGSLLRTLAGHPGGSRCVAVSPDSQLLATGGGDSLVKIWRIDDGSLVDTLPQAGVPLALAWTPDGGTLIVAAGVHLSWWNATDGSFRFQRDATAAISALSLSADGRLLAASLEQYGQNVTIWNVADGSLVRTLGGHVSFAQGVALAPAGDVLYSGSGYDNDVRAWSTADGTQVDHWYRETGWGPTPMLPLSVAPDGALIAYGRNDATLVVVRLAGQPVEDCGNGADDDSDGLTDCADPDCRGTPSCDDDGDTVPNSSDCAPDDPGAFAPPGEVPRLDVRRRIDLGSDVAALAWTDLSAVTGPALVGDAFTGGITQMWRDRGLAGASCLTGDTPTPEALDARPLPGGSDGFWYLVRAENACLAGPVGSDSSGLPRDLAGVACP
jgi:WD40 repeat protein